jgi:membrane-associated phospholipid phosphatase
MLRKLIPSLFLIVSFQHALFAQEDKKGAALPDTTKGNIFEKKPDVTAPVTAKEKKLEKKLVKRLYGFTQFVHETSLFVKQPTKWIRSDWIKLGIVTAATFAVMPFDEQITNSTQGEQRYYNNAFIEGGRIYGEWYSIGAVAGGFGIYGLLARDTSAKKIAIELLQAGLYSELLTITLKMIIGRARPVYTDNSFTYKPFTVADNFFQSMPSGHTTSAFALSAVMSRHAHSTVLKVFAYVPAGFTMFSRIYQHKHWLSDEIPAAAIGYFVGNWVVDLHEGKRHRINVTSMYPFTISYALN